MSRASHLRLWFALSLVFSFTLRPVEAAENVVAAQPNAEECEQFGRWIVERLEAKQTDQIMQRFDALAFARVATAGLDFNNSEMLEWSAGLRTGFARGMEAEFKSIESAHFVRVQEKDDQRRALVRITGANSAANYIAFICIRTESGPKWIDYFGYSSGDTLSVSARRLILPVVAEKKKSLLEKLTTSEGALIKSLPYIGGGIAFIRQGKPADALKVFRGLPAELRREKFILLLEMRAAQALDNKEYLQTLETIAQAFPQDPTLDLVLFDGDLLKKDYAGALVRLASFEKEIGGDAHLHYLRANVHIMQEDWPAAKRSARAALADEPTLFSAYDTLIAVALQEKKYRDVADILTELETNFPSMDMFTGIKDDEHYADFRKSPAYTDWLAARAKRAPELLRKPAP